MCSMVLLLNSCVSFCMVGVCSWLLVCVCVLFLIFLWNVVMCVFLLVIYLLRWWCVVGGVL